jgi:ABC-type phosphate/phosphonate transport system substrate-binding protein
MATTRKTNLLLGVVSYCSDILKIWDGMRNRLAPRGVNLDYVTFTNYERQVSALLHGHIDIAWNGPLAHVRLQKRAGPGRTVSLGMRDVDRDFQSVVVGRKGTKLHMLKDLENKKVFVGTYDSPQAYILPIHFLTEGGVRLDSIDITRFDVDVGKHGDTAQGETEVLKSILDNKSGCDVGIVSKMMFDRLDRKDELDIIQRFPVFDHCQFDSLSSLPSFAQKSFRDSLLAMNSSNDEQDREVMNMEGIKDRWEEPRESGYNSMRAALKNESYAEFPPPLHTVEHHPFRSLTIK